MPDAKAALRALLPFALHALAREVDAALGLVLHTSLELPNPAGEALGLLDPLPAALRVGAWVGAGALLWVALSATRTRGERSWGEALALEARGFAPLSLRPLVTLLALASVAIEPAYPYAFTLPVALTQDWGPAQDAAVLATWMALRLPGVRLPAPRTLEVFFIAFLAYALLSPERARHWDNHPGNEPKYLRMAVALGHELGLDVEGVSAPMEELTPRPLLAAAGDAAGALARESLAMLRAVAAGEAGASAIEATRITRQTIRGKEGGVYHVLPPGSSVLLAPALRVDRVLNRAGGTGGRLAVSLLFWNALAAALVAAVFVLARDATGRPGLGAALALGFAFVPPFLFYFFQFYPEMLGALGLALAFHLLLFHERWTARTAWSLGLVLAGLPWLHQKFLPVWAVLVVTALVRARRGKAPRGVLLGLLLPQAASLYLTALYNFAITGSVRPDALYLAWGPAGVTSERLGQGLLGLLLDARYGILPYVPLLLLGIGGLALAGARAALLWGALPGAAVYYLTVASADNWAGAVCNLGRYFMPLAPLLVAGAAVALDRLGTRRAVVALALVLSLWTGLLALALWEDPHAANDCALLLGRSSFADGNVYLPNLFIKTWSEGAPGLWARIAVWLLLAALLVAWLRRVQRGQGGASPVTTLAATAGVLLAAALLLERWPTSRPGPRFPGAVEAGPGLTVFFPGSARMEAEGAVVSAGSLDLLVRSRSPRDSLTAVVGGEGVLRVPGRAPLLVRPAGVRLELPLRPLRRLRDAAGAEETLYRQRLGVEGALIFRFGDWGEPAEAGARS